MKLKDLVMPRDEIRAKYADKGSPDYPSHPGGCGCSGCYASWCEWRGAAPVAEHFRARIAELEAALEKADRLAEVAQATLQKFGDEYVGRLAALEEELIYGYQAARAKVKGGA